MLLPRPLPSLWKETQAKRKTKQIRHTRLERSKQYRRGNVSKAREVKETARGHGSGVYIRRRLGKRGG
jgi:hypothetical protein